ncbi:hypothetical protein CBS14141_002508 [Malassezia furfur]|nr:hypothetical protein CBS14141_002508 [Malassezia furfur]
MSHGRRLVSLLGSVLIALSAGSTYAFSTYAPQLQDVLHLTSTQLNVLGLAGNLGIAVSSGALLVLFGYGMLSRAYKNEWNEVPVALLAVFMLMTGLGNSAGNNSAINVQAKSWGGSRRGTAMATVLSAFGLSALVYSTISHVFFAGNTTGYLDMLAFGSCASFLVGLAMLKIIPPNETEEDDEEGSVQRGRYQRVADAGTDGEETSRPRPRRPRSSSEVNARVYAWLDDMNEQEANEGDANDPFDEPSAHDHNVTGLQLLYEPDFFLLFTIVGLVSGAGLLLINNVGTITRALWDYNVHDEAGDALLHVAKHQSEKLEIQRIQSLQVSCISLGNASGRFLIGLVSDYLVEHSKDPTFRTLLLLPVTLMAVVSQGLAAWPNTITNVHRLLLVSSTTGLMYGTLFGLGPVLVFEWFGIRSFSLNWGFMSLSPVLGGNVYNLLFGIVYDSNVPAGKHIHRCLKGEDCYRTVFVWTTVGCAVAVLVSLVLIVRRVRRVAERLDAWRASLWPRNHIAME